MPLRLAPSAQSDAARRPLLTRQRLWPCKPGPAAKRASIIRGMTTEQDSASAFIQHWQGVTASELATSQSFVIELCELLGVPRWRA